MPWCIRDQWRESGTSRVSTLLVPDSRARQSASRSSASVRGGAWLNQKSAGAEKRCGPGGEKSSKDTMLPKNIICRRMFFRGNPFTPTAFHPPPPLNELTFSHGSRWAPSGGGDCLNNCHMGPVPRASRKAPATGVRRRATAASGSDGGPPARREKG